MLAEIGRRVREARLRAELSQEAAASRAEIDTKRWQRLEAGKVNATVRTLTRAAHAIGVSVWELLRAERPAR